MLNHLTYLYQFNLGFAEMLVKDLSAEQMVAQPGGVINHPAWSLGHLAVYSGDLGELLGLESNVPDGWSETFKAGGEPSGDSADYPSKEEILEELKQQHTRNTEAVKNFDTSRFADPHPDEGMRKYFPTRGDQIIFMMTSHERAHLGQIAVWRRAMGLGAAIRV